MFEENWQSLFEEDLDKLSEIINPVKDKTLKLEEGENRIVSIFFLDIKGFTSISEKLHPEKIKRIIDRIFKVFSNVIIKYGGNIDKYEGDKIMALFGSKRTSETDTERAVKSGLDILNKLKQINEMLKPQNIELNVRIGINTGLVTTGKVGLGREGDFTVYGDAVNLASRMESNAPLNSIMIPLKTKRLVTDVFKFESLGNIQVKGKTEPIEVYKVLGTAPDKIERWERSKLIKKPDYVGRENEFKQIKEFFKNSQKQIGKIDKEYKPVVIGLRGSAGLGKSRFIFEFTESIIKKHKIINPEKLVVRGYTKSYAQSPNTLFTALLKNYMNISDNDPKQTVEKKFEQTIAEIFEDLSKEERQTLKKAKPILGFLLGIKYDDVRLKNPDPKSLQTEIQLSLRHFLEAIAKVSNRLNFPLIIILEDLHWFDEASLNTLKVILTALNVEEKRTNKPCKNLFFLLSYRNEFKNLPEFGFRTQFKEFILKPLTIENSDIMILSMLGTIDIPEKIKNELLEKSEGNPFYIEEWIHSLIDNNVIEFINNKWQINKDITNIPIPGTLNSLILSRIDRMEDRLKSLLQKASVIGNSFLHSILEAIEITLGNEKTFNQVLSELINMDWLIKEKELEESDAKYLFKHIITCNVAYKTILNFNKKILHKLIAEFVEERFGKNKEYFAFLANHFEKAEMKDKTIEYLEKAGDHAKENYDNEQAIELYDKLLGQQITTELKIDTLLKKGEILRLIGKWKDAIKIFRNALKLSQELGDKKKFSNVVGNMGSVYLKQSNYSKAMECYEEKLKISKELGDELGIARVFGSKGRIYWSKGDYFRAKECFEKQLKISEELENKGAISKAVGNMGNVYKIQSNFTKAMECYEGQLKISEELGFKNGISVAVGNMGVIHYFQGNYVKAIECIDKQLKICEELGDKKGISNAVGSMGSVYLKQGNYSKAMECYKKDLTICEELGDKKGISIVLGNMGVIYSNQGNYSKAMECHEEELKICEEQGNKRGISFAFGNMGCIHYRQDDYPKAMECYKKDLTICEDLGDKSGISNAVGNMGDVYSNQGDYSKAMECFEKKLIICEELGDKSGISGVVENMGIVYMDQGNYEKAMECYDRAINIDDEIGYKHHLPYVLSDKAECLYKMKEYRKANEINEECLKISEEMKDEEHIFFCMVLKTKIEFKTIKNEELRIKNCIEPLEKLLEETKNEERIAALNYELAIMNNDLNREKNAHRHKKKALEQYKKLFKKTTNVEYKNRIEKLEKL
ncbi:MAG: tetratricopeptide repeat protein [Armatimonadetes bacterium]|nr:tetratricopeptide repeat protein [Armatimonadota bacterium]